jgi:hypothetical protein
VHAAHRLQALLADQLAEGSSAPPPAAALIEACALLATCTAARAESGGSSLLQRLSVIAELESASGRLEALVDDARRRLCVRFDPAAYAEVLACAALLDDGAGAFAASTTDVFAGAISAQLVECARACVFEQSSISPTPSADELAAAAASAASPAAPPPPRTPANATMPATSAAAAALATRARSSATASQRRAIQAAPLKELIGMIHEDKLIDAFAALLGAVAEVLVAHHGMVSHHSAQLAAGGEGGAGGALAGAGVDAAAQPPRAGSRAAVAAAAATATAAETAAAAAAPAAPAGAVLPRAGHEAILKALSLGRGGVWVELQRQLSVVIVFAHTATFSVEQMLRLLAQVELLMRLGHAFSGEAATVLRASLRTKSAAFYAGFHRERLDELRERLETELWQKVALSADARAGTLFCEAESRPAMAVHQASSAFIVLPAAAAADPAAAAAATGGGGGASGAGGGGGGGGGVGGSFFPPSYSVLEPLLDAELARLARGGGGTAAAVAAKPGLWARWQQAQREASGEPPPPRAPLERAAVGASAPVGEDGTPLAICGSALSVGKMVHRYVHMMAVLQPIAADALNGITALFELVVLAVFTQFWGGARVGSAGWDEGVLGEHLAPRLKGTLLRLHAVYVDGQAQHAAASAADTAAANRTAALRLVTSMHPASQPPGAAARIGPQECVCAADSLSFLAVVLQSARPHIEELLRLAYAQAAAPYLAQVATFYAQVIDSVPHVRDAILRALVRRALDLAAPTAAVVAHKWELKEIGTSESAYVRAFAEAAKTAVTHISLLPLSQAARLRLHLVICEMVSSQLVEVNARCTRAARALHARCTRAARALHAHARARAGRGAGLDAVLAAGAACGPGPKGGGSAQGQSLSPRAARAPVRPSARPSTRPPVLLRPPTPPSPSRPPPLLCNPAQGYAAARKCSQEGRAQMSIDVQTIAAELSALLSSPVSLERADSYIKAYYKPADELVEWAREGHSYSAKQLVSLVYAMPLKKKASASAGARRPRARPGERAATRARSPPGQIQFDAHARERALASRPSRPFLPSAQERDDVIKAIDEFRGGALSASMSSTLESMMNLNLSGGGAAASATAAAGAVDADSDAAKASARTPAGARPATTFTSIGKWASSEAAAKLKAANAAMTTGR